MFTHILATTTLLLASGATAMAASTAPVDIGALYGGRDLGRAPASVRVQVAIVLKYHHEAELDRLVETQADPDSPIYHRFLTPSEFRTYFSPTRTDYGRVVSALERGGFTVARTSPNNTVVDASAPAPVAARFFDTDIHRVFSPGVGRTYTNVRPGVVPREIADLTLAVLGLDGAHTFHAGPISLARGFQRSVSSLGRNGFPLFGPNGGYGPQILVDAYDLPAANGHTGTGHASGVNMSGDFLDSDLAAYLSYFGVPRTGPATTRIAVDGGAPPFPGGAAHEATLDVETTVSLAPGTALYMYELPNLQDRPVIDTYNRVVSDDFVDTLNSSYGDCERESRAMSRSVDAIETQGAAEGITFHSVAGDSGIYQSGCKSMSVAQPSSTPHNVAVGGTRLAVNATTGQEISEVGWSDPGGGATGGGVSVLFKVPSYQSNVPNIIATGRNVPDVAFDASASTGVDLYFNGSFTPDIDGGTSLSSPIFGAALTEINQLQGSRSGYFNVTLYSTWLANGYGNRSKRYFRDITQGSIPPYYAQTGYDQMSGIGALQADNFARLLVH